MTTTTNWDDCVDFSPFTESDKSHCPFGDTASLVQALLGHGVYYFTIDLGTQLAEKANQNFQYVYHT